MIYIDNSDRLTVPTTTIVKVIKGINILTEDGNLLIEPEISLDFKNIPSKYHQLILQIINKI